MDGKLLLLILTAWSMALLCLRESISRACKACSATSIHWITCSCNSKNKNLWQLVHYLPLHFMKLIYDLSAFRVHSALPDWNRILSVTVVMLTFSKNTGTASTTTALDLGSASIMYVRARHAWCIMSKLWSICSSVMRAGTTCLTGKPAKVSSLPITNN